MKGGGEGVRIFVGETSKGDWSDQGGGADCEDWSKVLMEAPYESDACSDASTSSTGSPPSSSSPPSPASADGLAPNCSSSLHISTCSSTAQRTRIGRCGGQVRHVKVIRKTQKKIRGQ